MKHLFLFAASFAAVQSADAATVVIWPVDPVLTAAQPATAMWLENKGDALVALQIRSLSWSQRDGSDTTADQDEVIASPPIAQVGPGQRQLVRLIRRNASRPVVERSYRILIDELPKPLSAAPDARASAQLAVQMRYSIPLFVQPEPTVVAPGPLVARITIAGAARFLEITNRGARHARLTDLRISSGGHDMPVRSGLVGYVLAGATMRFALPPTAYDGNFSVAVNGVDQTLLPAA